MEVKKKSRGLPMNTMLGVDAEKILYTLSMPFGSFEMSSDHEHIKYCTAT
jgi:hypothetical protein